METCLNNWWTSIDEGCVYNPHANGMSEVLFTFGLILDTPSERKLKFLSVMYDYFHA